MQLYGNPPVFPAAEETDAQASAKACFAIMHTFTVSIRYMTTPCFV
jgi:hypothetical protein